MHMRMMTTPRCGQSADARSGSSQSANPPGRKQLSSPVPEVKVPVSSFKLSCIDSRNYRSTDSKFACHVLGNLQGCFSLHRCHNLLIVHPTPNRSTVRPQGHTADDNRRIAPGSSTQASVSPSTHPLSPSPLNGRHSCDRFRTAYYRGCKLYDKHGSQHTLARHMLGLVYIIS